MSSLRQFFLVRRSNRRLTSRRQLFFFHSWRVDPIDVLVYRSNRHLLLVLSSRRQILLRSYRSNRHFLLVNSCRPSDRFFLLYRSNRHVGYLFVVPATDSFSRRASKLKPSSLTRSVPSQRQPRLVNPIDVLRLFLLDRSDTRMLNRHEADPLISPSAQSRLLLFFVSPSARSRLLLFFVNDETGCFTG